MIYGAAGTGENERHTSEKYLAPARDILGDALLAL
jgi:hypothetical protein